MDYQNKYKSKSSNGPALSLSKGFTLVEIVVVIAIFSLFAGISGTVYYNFQTENNLTMATNNIVESLRYSQKKSQIGSFDSVWKVKIYSDKVEILKDNILDETSILPRGINISGLNEVTFDKLSGKTANPGTITISNVAGSKEIIINSNGTLNY